MQNEEVFDTNGFYLPGMDAVCISIIGKWLLWSEPQYGQLFCKPEILVKSILVCKFKSLHNVSTLGY